MKVRVSTTADEKLKKLFDDYNFYHHKNYQDALELGMRQILIECHSTEAMSQAISIYREEASILIEEAEALTRLRAKLDEISENPIVHGSNGNQPELEKVREKVFLKRLESFSLVDDGPHNTIKISGKDKIIMDWQDRTAHTKWNWDSIITKYGFNDRDEAIAWFDKRIKALIAEAPQDASPDT